MSYIIEQTESLVRVLERAVLLPDYRLAGYAANAEFWVEEVLRCRKLLNGYKERFERMRTGQKKFLGEHGIEIHEYKLRKQPPELREISMSTDPRVTKGTKDSEIREAKQKLNDAAQRFIERLVETEVVSEDVGEALFSKIQS